MKETKKEKNHLLLLLLLLLITIIMFSTTTYAWFSANRMVTIDTLNIKVATVGGIDISADGVNWKNSIDTAELIDVKATTYTTNTNQIPLYLEPVSTGGDIDNTTGYLKMYYGTTINDTLGHNYYLTTAQSVEEFGYGILSKGKFIAFDIFLRTSTDKELYLTTDSGVTYGGDNSLGIENTFRIAFLDEGTTDIASSTVTIQSLRGATGAYFWEPNYDRHTDSGMANALDVYGITVGNIDGPLLPYEGVIDRIVRDDSVLLQEADSTHYPTKFRTMHMDYATVTNKTGFTKVFNANAGISKFRIYVWIEGQDVDCENNAAIGDANLYLQLSTNPA